MNPIRHRSKINLESIFQNQRGQDKKNKKNKTTKNSSQKMVKENKMSKQFQIQDHDKEKFEKGYIFFVVG